MFLFWKVYNFAQKLDDENIKIVYHTLNPHVFKVDLEWNDCIHVETTQNFEHLENKIISELGRELTSFIRKHKDCITVTIKDNNYYSTNQAPIKRISARATVYIQPKEHE